MDEYLGIIKIFGGNFAPQGWLPCDGRLLSISQNSALFSLLGTMYGGDGMQTFALPNLNGRVPFGIGSAGGDNITQGQIGGSASTTLTSLNMPPHTHTANVVQSAATLSVTSANASISTPTAGASIATPGSGASRSFTPTLGFDTSTPNVALSPSSVSLTPVSVSNTITGGGQPFSTMPPYLGVMYIICTSGLYPSRP